MTPIAIPKINILRIAHALAEERKFIHVLWPFTFPFFFVFFFVLIFLSATVFALAAGSLSKFEQVQTEVKRRRRARHIVSATPLCRQGVVRWWGVALVVPQPLALTYFIPMHLSRLSVAAGDRRRVFQALFAVFRNKILQ